MKFSSIRLQMGLYLQSAMERNIIHATNAKILFPPRERWWDTLPRYIKVKMTFQDLSATLAARPSKGKVAFISTYKLLMALKRKKRKQTFAVFAQNTLQRKRSWNLTRRGSMGPKTTSFVTIAENISSTSSYCQIISTMCTKEPMNNARNATKLAKTSRLFINTWVIIILHEYHTCLSLK